ncbi:DHH family protein [Desulfuromusa kysingii]|uniref:DHH family protein n=1 Tax=Desulfuromusa kysingii TaxID=37625 RepID=A0A1H4D0C6_9BACT|nr:DHH family phosphoesterase [Desulfuromusa kysingii]SEA65970.1 DHH family protein [Desulfuromusa kysingii]
MDKLQSSTEDSNCINAQIDDNSVGNMIEWIRGRGKILIICHDNPDPDSIASAVALRHLILIKTGQDAVLSYGGVIGRSENRKMVELLEISLVPICELNLSQFAVICMVDTQPDAGNNSLPSGHQVHLVIDHHPSKKDPTDIFWVDVRENYGASATILYEYLNSQKVSINTKLATSLFYAIKSETQDLGREWSKADREAYLKLLPISNNQILYDIIHPPVPRNYFSAFHTAIENSRVFGEMLVFNLHTIDNPDLVAELADFLLREQGIRYVFGMGWFNGTQILSMRSLNPEAKLGLVIQQVIAGIGTAGGHGMIAGGQVRDIGEDQHSQLQLEKLLIARLFEVFNVEPSVGESLI